MHIVLRIGVYFLVALGVGSGATERPSAASLAVPVITASNVAQVIELQNGRFTGTYVAVDIRSDPWVAKLQQVDTNHIFSLPDAGSKSIIWVRNDFLQTRVALPEWAGVSYNVAVDQGPPLTELIQLLSALGGGEVRFDAGVIWVAGQRNGEAMALRGLNNIVLRGRGADKTTIALLSTNGFNMVRTITIASSKNVSVVSLGVDGNMAELNKRETQNYPKQMAGIFLSDNDGIVIDDVQVYNTAGDAIRLGGSPGNTDKNITIVNTKWDFNGRNGVTLGGHGFENILIKDVTGGANVGAQQIDFEPIGPGKFNAIKIERVLLRSTGREKDNYSIVVSGKRANGNFYPATDVLITGSRIEGTILIRNAHRVDIVGNAYIVSDNPYRGGAIEMDYGPNFIQVQNNNCIKKTGNNARQRGQKDQGHILIKRTGGVSPRSIFVGGNIFFDDGQPISASECFECRLLNDGKSAQSNASCPSLP